VNQHNLTSNILLNTVLHKG